MGSTRGLSLPLATLDPLLLSVIAKGLALAAQSLSTDHPTLWASGSEAEINTMVEMGRFVDLSLFRSGLPRCLPEVSGGEQI